ncbi:MAG: hypothetical protein FWG57_02000 [Endomicrobia bacterium]|jgi:hypothetical protein|nr:hypothetical protein [Endomicrobiia bacterium]
MKKKIAAVIISFFLFSLSVPQACFAEAGLYFAGAKSAEISSKTAKAVSLLDISDKIVRKYYGGTKDFFFNMYVKDAGNNKLPSYNSKTDEIALCAVKTITLSNKKSVHFGKDFICFTGFVSDRMRGSPFGDDPEITKQYLLSIEALQKGSVPVDVFVIGDVLI